MLLIAALGVATVGVLVPSAPPPDEPLTIGVVDDSAFPVVQIDIVVPPALSAVELQPEMIDVDGVPIESLTAVDPRHTTVALVIDDRPALDEDVVTLLQGSIVELVRNVGTGTEIAFATPSGLRSTPTADQAANIARIADITAGAPAATPLPQLITDTVTELGSSTRPDRHAVVVLGGDPAVSLPDSYRLINAIAATGTKVHLVVPRAVDAGALAAVAERSGGIVALAPGFLAAIDEVTAAVARRYSIVAIVSGAGEHRVGLTVDDQRYEAVVDVASPTTPSPTTPPAATPAPTNPAPVVTPAATTPATVPVATGPASDVTQPAAESGAPAPLLTLAPSESSTDDGTSWVLAVVVVPVVALLAGTAVYVLLGRRKPRRRAPRIMGELPPAPATSAADEPVADDQGRLEPWPPEPTVTEESTPYVMAPAFAPTPEPHEEPTAEPGPHDEPTPVLAPLAQGEEPRRRRRRRRGRERSIDPTAQATPERPPPGAEEPEPASAAAPPPIPVRVDEATALAAATDGEAGEEPAWFWLAAEEPEPAATSEDRPLTRRRRRQLARRRESEALQSAQPAPDSSASAADVAPEPTTPAAATDQRAPSPATAAAVAPDEPAPTEPTPEPETPIEAAKPEPPKATLPGRAVDRRGPRPLRRPASPSRRRSLASKPASGHPPGDMDASAPVANGGRPPRRGSTSPARGPAADDWIVAGHLRLSPSRQVAWTGRWHIRLSPGEYRVLELLVTSGDEGVTQEEIIAAGGVDEQLDTETADAFVARLRRKTGFGRRQPGVRKQSTVTYYLDDSGTS